MLGYILSIKNIDIKVRGPISDAQKSIRLAIKELFPEPPHQYCQFHYLKDIAKPLVDKERKLKKFRKNPIKYLSSLENSWYCN
jgi:hypothetical protein